MAGGLWRTAGQLPRAVYPSPPSNVVIPCTIYCVTVHQISLPTDGHFLPSIRSSESDV